MRRSSLGGGLPLVLALILAVPQAAVAAGQSIARADNPIVFAGPQLDAYSEIHFHIPFKASHYAYEAYAAQWMAGKQRVPVLRAILVRLPPGRSFAGRRGKSLESAARGQKWAKGLAFAANGSGSMDTALGPAEYLIFTAGDYRCGVFQQYLNERRNPDRPDDMTLRGLYCPVSGELDSVALGAVLARIGVRDIAMPEAGPR